jgi:RNA recognition motif-containing protein
MAPIETVKPILDISKIGLISSAVLDGPNKIFIGGLHYHLQENQVLELLQAFGKVKAFHLVKNEPDSQLSKGYCFVEYVDPAVTPIAIAGLNGMDIGGGKSLTSRLAGERNGMIQPPMTAANGAAANASSNSIEGQPDMNHKTIVSGYDVEAIVDAAMGQGPMPQGPSYFDANGIPLTRIVPIIPGVTPLPKNRMTQPAVPIPTIPQQQSPVSNFQQLVVPPPNTLTNSLYPPQQQGMYLPNDSNTTSNMSGQPQMMMDYSGPSQQQPPQQQLQQPMMPMYPTMTPMDGPVATKVLVLLNMVSDSDLETDDEYNGLVEEVRDECAKYGTLLQVQIPRYVGTSSETGITIEASALRKVYLSYATVEDAIKAQQELSGRQFGPNVVETQFYPETDFTVGLFR